MAYWCTTLSRLAAPSVVCCVLLFSNAVSHAQRVAVKAVHIARDGDLYVVTIEADGPLPAPTVGQLDSPPRFFLDFSGVNASTRGASGADGAAVIRVRVALHSAEPRVTRVVLDLVEQQPIRTEPGERESGRFKVLVGASAPDTRPVTTPVLEPGPVAKPQPATAARREIAKSAEPLRPQASTTGEIPPAPLPASSLPPPVPGLPPPAAPPQTSPSAAAPLSPPIYPARPPSEPLPERDVERYRSQVEEPLKQLTQLRPLLATIDRGDVQPPAGLRQVREQLSGVLRALTAVRPPDTIRSLHDLLLRSASFALMSATLRDDAGLRADPEKLKNAASAAAGALLLLDRVCKDIPCDPANPAR